MKGLIWQPRIVNVTLTCNECGGIEIQKIHEKLIVATRKYWVCPDCTEGGDEGDYYEDEDE